MYRFDGLNMELTRGDSLQFKVNIQGRDLPEKTLAVFSVKKRAGAKEAMIEKRIEVGAGGVVLVGLSHEDTDLAPRTSWWDLRVLIPLGDGTYEVRTPMEYAAFNILGVIGDV